MLLCVQHGGYPYYDAQGVCSFVIFCSNFIVCFFSGFFASFEFGGVNIERKGGRKE